MNAAQCILLRLEALDCLAPEIGPRVRESLPIDPVVLLHRGGASDFGTVNGQMSVAELSDLIALWKQRVAALDAWYAAASPLWVNKDSAAFIAFTNDRVALENRYAGALSAAQTAVTAAALAIFTPNATIPAQVPYDALMKAMRQCYPPDGCPTTKGDYADLMTRANAVSPSLGIPGPLDPAPQPTAVDVDQQIFAVTAPVDPVAQITGAQKGGPLPNAPGGLSWLAWVEKHRVALVVTGVAVIGGILFIQVAPLLALPFKAAKGLGALGSAVL